MGATQWVPLSPPLGGPAKDPLSLSPLSMGLEGLHRRSSSSFSRATRCCDFAMTSCSIAWITGSHPSHVLSCRAVNLSMFCRRSCVRLQRGASFGTWSERKMFEAVGQSVIDAPRQTSRCSQRMTDPGDHCTSRRRSSARSTRRRTGSIEEALPC